MQPLSIPKLIVRRLADDWVLLLTILFGITLASSLVAAAPTYLRTLERLGVNTAIDRSTNSFLDIHIFAPHVPLTRAGFESSQGTVARAVRDSVGDAYRGERRYLKSNTFLVGLPDQPLPEGQASHVRLSQGFFQWLEDVDSHIHFLDGRMVTDRVDSGPRGPVIEAMVGAPTAETFALRVGDAIDAVPFLGHDTRITAEIVGILDATDPTEEYWRDNANIFLYPQPIYDQPELNVIVNPEEPPLALFISKEAMLNAVGAAYPGSLATSTWMVFLYKDALKEWSIDESYDRLHNIEQEIAGALPGSIMLTGITKMLNEFERRSFFSSVPLLLLLALMVVTVLYFLVMMVSYLVKSRENDVALLMTRGVSITQLMRLYALEGLVLTAVSVVAAPFLAMGAIALAGKLPYFRDLTGGDILPVQLAWMPFLVALGAGAFCLALYVMPGVIGARAGLIVHRLRSSRPPSTPIFQRYYIDLALLAVGGLIFWELHSRGHVLSGGLFEDVQVNEAVLLAPIMFLIVVALLFMRLFPLLVRYFSGESPAPVHLLAALSTLALGAGAILEAVLDQDAIGWMPPAAMLLAVGGAYRMTQLARGGRGRAFGLALQAALIAWFMVAEAPSTGDILFPAAAGLAAVVPAQVLFLTLRALMHKAPVWVSMGLWRMARNPLQYSWLVLLLVLATGLGILATTVGGTLETSTKERILYDVGTDIRVSNVSNSPRLSNDALKSQYLAIPGVTSVSLGIRLPAVVGSTSSGTSFNLLGIESREFPYMAWYRDDFSERSFPAVMRSLQPSTRAAPIEIPEGTTHLSAWVRPSEEYPNISFWMVVNDSRGITRTISLGPVGEPEWHRIDAEMPSRLEPPLELVSIQIFEPGYGPTGTPGAILMDDIAANIDGGDETVILDDFEGRLQWNPLISSRLSSDKVSIAVEDVLRGERSAQFAFGKDTDRGIRGMYYRPRLGAIPIVVSRTFSVANGVGDGDAFIVGVSGRLVTMVVRDVIDYFPTLSPYGGGFALADLDTLLEHLRIVSPVLTITSNELFFDVAPGAYGTVRAEVHRRLGRTAAVRIFDTDSRLDDVRLDPLIAAGWRAMVVVAAAIIIVTAGLGYVTYLLSFFDRHRREIGFLRTLGLTRRQIVGLIGLEHVVVALIGLGLGTWAGFQMSELMVSSISITERGRSVLPPFILGTDWSFMAPVYAALILIFGAALAALVRGTLRQDVNEALRAEAQ